MCREGSFALRDETACVGGGTAEGEDKEDEEGGGGESKVVQGR